MSYPEWWQGASNTTSLSETGFNSMQVSIATSMKDILVGPTTHHDMYRIIIS